MTIYYVQSNSIVANRYDTVPNNVSDTVPNLPNSTVSTQDINSITIPNFSTTSDLSALSHSISFGYDGYIYNKIQYKPIFILNNKFYQN